MMVEVESRLSAGKPEPEGIAGWLLLPLGLLVLTVVGGLIAATVVLPDLLLSDYVFHAVAGTALFVGAIDCLVRFVNRRRETRSLMMALCGVTLAFLALLYIFPPHIIRGGPALVALATLVYFMRSKRVKNTFVH